VKTKNEYFILMRLSVRAVIFYQKIEGVEFMLNWVVKDIRTGVISAKQSAILWGAFYYLIAAVLLFSGISKIIDPLPMIETMKAAFKVDENLLIIAATGLPVIEAGLGVMLLLNQRRKETISVITVLSFSFLVFSVYGTAIGLNTDCGCFGASIRSQFGISMIIRNIVLLTIVLWLAVTYKKFASAGHFLQIKKRGSI
jgi:hypothetical protein